MKGVLEITIFTLLEIDNWQRYYHNLSYIIHNVDAALKDAAPASRSQNFQS